MLARSKVACDLARRLHTRSNARFKLAARRSSAAAAAASEGANKFAVRASGLERSSGPQTVASISLLRCSLGMCAAPWYAS